MTVIPLGRALLPGSSDLPGSGDAPSRHVPAVLAIRVRPITPPRTKSARALISISRSERTAGSSPIWSCSVWGLPCRRHCWRRGALLPHLFTLTPPDHLNAQPTLQGCSF